MRPIYFVLTVIILSASACATVQVPFSDAEFAPYVGDGPATLEGQAVLRTVGGGVRTCAGSPAILAPATQYDKSVVRSFGFGMNIAMRRAGPAAKYWRETTCDAQGTFIFSDVPAGNWIVMTSVSWDVQSAKLLPGRYQITTDKQGGTLIGEITLRPGKGRFIMSDRHLVTPGLF